MAYQFNRCFLNSLFCFQLWIDLSAVHAYVALSGIEIFVTEDPSSQSQTPYDNSKGSGWIVTEHEDVKLFQFDEVCFFQ